MIDKLKRKDIIKLLILMKKRMPLYVGTVIIKNLVSALCFNIVIAFITKKSFDAVTTGKFYLIRDAAVLAMSCYIIGSIIQPVVSLISNKCVKETMREIKNSCYKTLAGLDNKVLEAEHSGEYISIATNGIANIEELYSIHINMLVFSLFNGIFAMISVMILEWRIGLCILAIGLVTVFINKSFALRIRRLTDEIQSKLNKITSKLMDIQSSIENTKMFQAEARVHGIFASENKKHFDISMRLGRVDASFTAINVLFSNVKYIGILCLSLYMFFKGYIVIGTVMAVMQLMGNANYMFDNIGTFLKDTQKSLTAGADVLKLLNMDQEIESCAFQKNTESPQVEGAHKNLFDNANSYIDIQKLYYTYSTENLEEQKPVLKDISMNIDKGKTVAVVGGSGSGKSTLAKLLLGINKIKEGNIYIDGNNIFDYSLSELREKISYVPQNSYTFYGSIRDNISYGKIDATDEQIIAAAKAADAHEFIMKLPQGYGTVIGENGNDLSGGQKQRIGIARAFLKEAPILILDEATSALDTETEHAIQEALLRLTNGKTVIIIAHRLSTIKAADMIYVLNEGQIVEHGSHKELLAKRGYYQNLYKLQQKAYIC